LNVFVLGRNLQQVKEWPSENESSEKAKHTHTFIKPCDWEKYNTDGKLCDWWISNRAAGLPVPKKPKTYEETSSKRKPRRIADLAVADGLFWVGKSECLFLIAGVWRSVSMSFAGTR